MSEAEASRCPRCLGPRSLFDGDAGARSRVTLARSVSICGLCGQDESTRELRGLPPIPPEDWPVAVESLMVWPTGSPSA